VFCYRSSNVFRILSSFGYSSHRSAHNTQQSAKQIQHRLVSVSKLCTTWQSPPGLGSGSDTVLRISVQGCDGWGWYLFRSLEPSLPEQQPLQAGSWWEQRAAVLRGWPRANRYPQGYFLQGCGGGSHRRRLCVPWISCLSSFSVQLRKQQILAR